MALYFKDIEITNIDNLVPQTGLDITDLWFGETNVYTVWETYEGTLPATINANGADMRQYQVYGNTGGVGEEVDITGLSEPLCGIQTYTDSLDLSTGILTRRIKKLVFDGTENWAYQSAYTRFTLNLINAIFLGIRLTPIICTHYIAIYDGRSITDIPNDAIYIGGSTVATQLAIKTNDYTTIDDFKSFLAAQYAAGTPVTMWYVLAEPGTSTITVPSGLTGTIKGYLIQDGTPTPETPIYPTANGTKQADDTYSIKYGYKLDISTSDGTNATTTPIYIGSDPLDNDEYVDYQAGKVYRMINGSLTPTDPPAPLPALPTCEGATIVGYAGSGTAPEKVLLKYRKEGY